MQVGGGSGFARLRNTVLGIMHISCLLYYLERGLPGLGLQVPGCGGWGWEVASGAEPVVEPYAGLAFQVAWQQRVSL